MMWVRFVANFDWDPPERNGRVTLAFEAGKTYFVRKSCGRAAINKGVAYQCARPEQ